MTNKSIDVSRLVTELRKRFGSAKNLCRVLGIDENLLKSGLALDSKGNRLARDLEMMGPNGSSPSTEADKKWRVELEQILADADVPAHVLEKVLAKLDERHPLSNDEDDLSGAEVEQLRRREQHGEEALDAEGFEKFLRGKGVDEETIKGALDLFPPNALPNGGGLGRGLGVGAKFAAKRAAGMDSAVRKFGLGRIEAWAAADQAVDSRPVPSTARLERIDRKFGTDRIGVHGAAGGSTW